MAASNSTRTNKPKSGDATGRKKAEQEAEQAEELRKRQEELTMINEQIQVENQDGVFDPRTGALLDENGNPVKRASDPEEPPKEPYAVDKKDSGVIDLGATEVSRLPEEVVIRVNENLDSVTVGAGNHYTFRAGQQYKVPRHVAVHLDEKGYVWH